MSRAIEDEVERLLEIEVGSLWRDRESGNVYEVIRYEYDWVVLHNEARMSTIKVQTLRVPELFSRHYGRPWWKS